MNDSRINTIGIQGLGGTGKSIIASYLYRHSNFVAKFWADVSLKPNFTVFAEKIIIALGGKVAFPIDITELINNLLTLLSQSRCLLVVDNLETLLNTDRNWQDEYYQEFFRRWLQQGTCSTLLITTQDKPKLFQGLEHWYSLGGMKIEEGVELFNKFGIIGTDEEIKEFVKYAQGHPLTISLVAGFLIEDCNSQFSQVEELELEQFELAYQEASGAHRDKQDARLSWIVQQHLGRLSLEQTEFLINLSVYRLPFNREAAQYMWKKIGVKLSVINEKLRELCNRSLLIKTEVNNFKFESLVQKFILQQENNLTNAHINAIEYYRTNLKNSESWQVLEDVREYLEIINHHCELNQFILAKKFLDNCIIFLDLRGYHSILIEIYEKLILRWGKNLKSEELCRFADSLNNLGTAYYSLGKYQQAIGFYQQSLAIQREIGDRNGKSLSLLNLGNVYSSLGKYQQAINFYQKSLTIQQEIGDRNGEGLSLLNLGNAYHFLGEYQQAIDYLQKSLDIQQEIGDHYGEGLSLNNLGNTYNCLGEYQQAINFYQQSLDIQQEIGDRNGEGSSLNNLGNTYNCLGEYQQAINYFQQSLEIQQEIGDRYGEGISLMNLGNAYNFLEEYQQAIDYLQQSLGIARQIGSYYEEARSLGSLGNAYNCLGEYQQAIDYLQQSLAIFQEIGSKKGEASSWFNLGDTQKKLQQKSEAKSAYENARKLYLGMRLDKNVKDCDLAIQELDNDDSSR